MTKSELVAEISKVAKTTKQEAEQALNGIFDAIKETLSKGKEIRLTGFGSFKVNQRAARTGRNPRTGQEIKIAASKAPVFKAGKELKDAVNK